MSLLLVLSESDAFAAEWDRLAGAAGLELRLQRAAEESPPGDAAAVLLVVAGAEPRAESLIRAARAAGYPPPLVVGTEPDHRLAVALMRAGADDYFALPADLEPLRARVGELAERNAARAASLRVARAEREAFDFGRIIGTSEQLREALQRAARIIPRGNATVLITGETGTGKELLAQAIHYNGPRAAAPLVEVNCAAIPPTLLESELFGHEKGAFTDARAAKPGLLEAAHGGTLFLDEIGHLPLPLQAKFLRVLEDRKVRRVGAVAQREVDVRIIAATHVDLAQAVAAGEFREDLFYRLSVIPIHLPALRERGADVVLLAEHFAAALAEQYGLPRPVLGPELQAALLDHPWPGNVRELRNAIERALLLGDGPLQPRDLFPVQRAPTAPAGRITFPAPLAEIEREAAREMLRRLDGNKSAAADALGISRSRFYRLLEQDPVAR